MNTIQTFVNRANEILSYNLKKPTIELTSVSTFTLAEIIASPHQLPITNAMLPSILTELLAEVFHDCAQMVFRASEHHRFTACFTTKHYFNSLNIALPKGFLIPFATDFPLYFNTRVVERTDKLNPNQELGIKNWITSEISLKMNNRILDLTPYEYATSSLNFLIKKYNEAEASKLQIINEYKNSLNRFNITETDFHEILSLYNKTCEPISNDDDCCDC